VTLSAFSAGTKQLKHFHALTLKGTSMNFGSDNVYGVHPKIMAAIVKANEQLTAVSYCHDDGALLVEQALSRVFEKNVKAFLVMNGTGANSLALSALCPAYGSVFCHEGAHINTDECSAPELFTGGAKLVPLPGDGNKLRPDVISHKLSQQVHGEHGAKPSVVSISNVTELGTVYTVKEIAAIAEVARAANMKLHMDGARFANALVSLGCTPAEMTWKAGVDVLSFGGTKNGGMILEAVVFFNEKLADDFLYRRKRGGQLLSKGRYLSAQMLSYLEDDLWLSNARQANDLARELSNGINQLPNIRLSQPCQANEVFAFMPEALYEKLTSHGVHFYEWPVDGMKTGETHVRFVLSYATPHQDVAQFVALARTLA
jgi:threonine aldolase